MATSAALTNSDILDLIFEWLSDSDVRIYDDDHANLARAARVCVAFYEPALRQLWSYFPGMVPLLRLLPSSWTRVAEDHTDGLDGTVHYDTYVSTYITLSVVTCGSWPTG